MLYKSKKKICGTVGTLCLETWTEGQTVGLCHTLPGAGQKLGLRLEDLNIDLSWLIMVNCD